MRSRRDIGENTEKFIYALGTCLPLLLILAVDQQSPTLPYLLSISLFVYNNMWEDTGKRPRLLPLVKFSSSCYLQASSLEVTRDLRSLQTLCVPSLEPQRRKRNRNEIDAAEDLARFIVATEQEVYCRRGVLMRACAREAPLKRRRTGLIGPEKRVESERKRGGAVRAW